MAPLFVRQLHYQKDSETGTYTFGKDENPSEDFQDMPYSTKYTGRIPLGSAETATHLDLAGYARYYRQQGGAPPADPLEPAEKEVLRGLARYETGLSELAHEAAVRPLSRFPVDWYRGDVGKIRSPHLIFQKRLIDTLCLRADARLTVGQEDAALADLLLAFRLCRDLGDGQYLIGSLMQMTSQRRILSAVWDGLADQRWSAPSLTRLQEELQSGRFLERYPDILRRERMFAAKLCDHLKQEGNACFFRAPYDFSKPAAGSGRWFIDVVDGLTPAGWYDLNKALQSRWMQDCLIDAVNPAIPCIHPTRVTDGTRLIGKAGNSITTKLFRDSAGIFELVTRKLTRVQATTDQARIACVLERFFLDHREYPRTLDELVPIYLAQVPHDVIDGGPLHYQTTPAGRFQLYSAGWNEQDDGGKVVWLSSRALNDEKGDWVWQYKVLDPPAPPAEDQKHPGR